MSKTSKIKNIFIRSGVALVSLCICTAICVLFDHFKINDLNFLMIYVVGVLITAVLTKGAIYSTLLSVCSVFVYNFLFTEPRYTFRFNDKMYMVTFLLMLIVGATTGLVTTMLRRKMEQINAINLEKEQLKSEAEKEQLKATLLRSISHDLRTPLTAIRNGAEIMQGEQPLLPEDREEILDGIVQKCDWTIRLVENLLSLTRIDSENLTVTKTPEALEEVIPQAVRNMREVLKGRKVHYDLPDELMLVPMDATLILQALGNILSNAAKHTKEGGNITIKVWNSGKNAVFRIANDGEQIKERDLPFIFDLYYTTGDGSGERGVGLGLAIVKLIITAHGGDIEARNTPEGVVFEFDLPMEESYGRNISD